MSSKRLKALHKGCRIKRKRTYAGQSESLLVVQRKRIAILAWVATGARRARLSQASYHGPSAGTDTVQYCHVESVNSGSNASNVKGASISQFGVLLCLSCFDKLETYFMIDYL